MAFFMDPGAMFLGCLGPSEQKFLVTLIETAAKSGYTTVSYTHLRAHET